MIDRPHYSFEPISEFCWIIQASLPVCFACHLPRAKNHWKLSITFTLSGLDFCRQIDCNSMGTVYLYPIWMCTFGWWPAVLEGPRIFKEILLVQINWKICLVCLTVSRARGWYLCPACNDACKIVSSPLTYYQTGEGHLFQLIAVKLPQFLQPSSRASNFLEVR